MDIGFEQPLDTAKHAVASPPPSTGSINGTIKYDPRVRVTSPLRQSSIEPWVQTEARTEKQMFDIALNSFGNLKIVDEESLSVNSKTTKPLRSALKDGAPFSRRLSKRAKRRASAEAITQTDGREGDPNRPSYSNIERREKKVRMSKVGKSYYPSDKHNELLLFEHYGASSSYDAVVTSRKLSRSAKAKLAFARKLEIEKIVGCVRAGGQGAISPKDIQCVKIRQASQSWTTPEEQLVILKRNFAEAKSLLDLAHEKAGSGIYGTCRRVVDTARQFYVVKLVELARADGTLSENEIGNLMERFPTKGLREKKNREEERTMEQLVANFEALWFGSTFSRFKHSF